MATITKLYTMSMTKFIRNKRELMEEYEMSLRTVDKRIAEIREEMRPGGRYANLMYVIGGNGKSLQINYLVWFDHEMVRDRLAQKNLRKNLPPYNPAQVARELALYADKELAMEGMRE